MATKTSAVMTVTNGAQDTISRTISDVSPDATDAQLKALAVGLSQLTTNSLVSVERVEKSDVPLTGKFTPNIKLVPDTIPSNNLKLGAGAPYIYILNAPSARPTFTLSGSAPKGDITYGQGDMDGLAFIKLINNNQSLYEEGTETATWTLTFAETETTNAVTVSLKFTNLKAEDIVPIGG